MHLLAVLPITLKPSGGNIMEKVRMNLILSGRAARRLTALRDFTEVSSNTDVMKNALKLYEFAVQEAEKGNSFCIKNGDGSVTECKIFL